MKTDRENTRLKILAGQLGDLFKAAGYTCKVEYIESAEAFLVKDGTQEYVINCFASSVSACLIDIFTQGAEIVPKLNRG